MFEKTTGSREHGHEPETIIAASVKVEGDFASQGNVLIEGVVEGSLRTESDLRVGERARIAADVSAANAVVAGEIRGNLVVGERLELESTARVHGDVKTKILVVASGATINGKLQMGAEVTEHPGQGVSHYACRQGAGTGRGCREGRTEGARVRAVPHALIV
jgi:cytoskeletal protein CcmA (bactofilin family)